MTTLGVQGDQQRDLDTTAAPSGPSASSPSSGIHALQAEGHAIVPGAIGENITVGRLDWSAVVRRRPSRRWVTRCWSRSLATLAVLEHQGRASRAATSRASPRSSNPGDSRVYARVLRPARSARATSPRPPPCHGARSAPALTCAADVVIVGGGVTGVSIAFHLAGLRAAPHRGARTRSSWAPAAPDAPSASSGSSIPRRDEPDGAALAPRLPALRRGGGRPAPATSAAAS